MATYVGSLKPFTWNSPPLKKHLKGMPRWTTIYGDVYCEIFNRFCRAIQIKSRGLRSKSTVLFTITFGRTWNFKSWTSKNLSSRFSPNGGLQCFSLVFQFERNATLILNCRNCFEQILLWKWWWYTRTCHWMIKKLVANIRKVWI